MRRGSIIVIGLCVSAGCDPGVISVADDTYVAASDTTVADTAVVDSEPEVEVTPQLATESAAIARVFSGDVTGFVSLADALVVGDDGGWWWVDAGGARRVTTSDTPLPLVAPSAAAPLGDVIVIAAPDGLRLIAAGALRATPLDDAFDEPIHALEPTSIGFWLAGSEHLWRLVDDQVAAVETSLPTANARLARGTRDAQPALWIAAGAQVYALTDGDKLVGWPELAVAATDLATDRLGRVWVIDTAANVHRRAPDGTWTTLDISARAVDAQADSDDVWLTASDAVYHMVGDELRRVTNAPLPTATAIAASGRLLALGADGIDELAPGRVLTLLGLVSGARLTTATEITVRATTDAVTSVTSTLDDDPLATSWSFTLDPVHIANGDHTVTTTLLYNDAQTLAADLPFTVHFPTWQAEVRDLYERRCARCHDATEGASTAVLDAPDAWSERIDCIMCRVSVPFDRSRPECLVCEDVTSSMPPTGELPAEDIELIRQWRIGDFRLE